jgi:hypothetical protein
MSTTDVDENEGQCLYLYPRHLLLVTQAISMVVA